MADYLAKFVVTENINNCHSSPESANIFKIFILTFFIKYFKNIIFCEWQIIGARNTYNRNNEWLVYLCEKGMPELPVIKSS